jgi:hypothetical protein
LLESDQIHRRNDLRTPADAKLIGGFPALLPWPHQGVLFASTDWLPELPSSAASHRACATVYRDARPSAISAPARVQHDASADAYTVPDAMITRTAKCRPSRTSNQEVSQQTPCETMATALSSPGRRCSLGIQPGSAWSAMGSTGTSSSWSHTKRSGTRWIGTTGHFGIV